MDSKLETIEEVAIRTRLPIATLRYFRQIGKGPKSAKLGRRLVYRAADVDAWISEQFAADQSQRPA